MKKLIILLTATMMAVNAVAQSVETPTAAAPAAANTRLYCVGNDYYYQGQVLNQSEMLDFYAQHNCQAAYDRFKEGKRTATIGWAFLGVGVAFDLGAVTCFGAYMGRRYANKSYNMPARKVAASGSVDTSDPAYMGMVACGTAAALFELAAIPCLVVGFHKQHTSVDVYNILTNTAAIPQHKEPQPYMAIQSSASGLGLALHF